MFLGLLDPDPDPVVQDKDLDSYPVVQGTDPDPYPSIIKQN